MPFDPDAALRPAAFRERVGDGVEGGLVGEEDRVVEVGRLGDEPAVTLVVDEHASSEPDASTTPSGARGGTRSTRSR